MTDSESQQAGDDWWSSGADDSRSDYRLGRLGAPAPNYPHSQQPGHPVTQYAAPAHGYTPYPPPPSESYGAGYPGSPSFIPPYGPGSVADPGSRLGARVLDAIFMIPVVVLAFVLSTAIVRPWQSAVVNQIGPNSSTTSVSFGRLGVWFVVTFLFMLIGWTLYETLFTHLMGRTPGKAIVHIRPQWDGHLGSNLTFGRSLARSVTYWMWGLIPYIGGILGLVSVLSLLWNPRRQCWHDRICSTVVVTDR